MGCRQDLDGRVRRLSLEPASSSSGVARAFVGRACRDWGVVEEIREDAELVVTELVANVVDHARTRCVITIRYDDARLRIEVEDFYPCSIPTSPRADPTAPRGRGLLVVAGLSAAWGVRDLPDGKSVWAVMGTL